MSKPRIYLCSRVRKESRPFNERVARALSTHYEVFVPHIADLNNPADGVFDVDGIFKQDFAEMLRADVFVVCGGDVGKDCAWEIGWASAMKIPIYFAANGAEDYLKSPMLIPSLSTVIKNIDEAGKEIFDVEASKNKTI